MREAQIMSWSTTDNSLKPFEDAVQVQNVFDRQRLNYDAEAEIQQPDEVPEVQQTDID